MLLLKNIRIVAAFQEVDFKGYIIEFQDNRRIYLTKRRTIIALLVLIHYGEGTEADLAQGNTKISEIRELLQGKINPNLIQDFYGDANKPYSELWNEEGFSFIDNLASGRKNKSQKYVLHLKDHDKLFEKGHKAYRKAPSETEKEAVRAKQNGYCNLCASKLLAKKELSPTTYAKDRRREVFDHRKPVEKGGESVIENYQALCFYCNKCKWQICNICTFEDCNTGCALRFPEHSQTIAPTNENISDLLKRNLLD